MGGEGVELDSRKLIEVKTPGFQIYNSKNTYMNWYLYTDLC